MLVKLTPLMTTRLISTKLYTQLVQTDEDTPILNTSLVLRGTYSMSHTVNFSRTVEKWFSTYTETPTFLPP